MDLAWSDFLPLGLLMSAGTVVGFARRRAGRALARRDFPKLAESLGLSFQAASGVGGVGRIVGELDGVRVRVESDERARVVCHPPHPFGLDVRNYAHAKRTPHGFETFSLGNRADDDWLPNRFVRADLRDTLPNPALRAALETLRPYRARLREFTIDADRVECVFDFGSPPFLPTSVAREVVPALVELARSTRPERSGPSGVGAAR